VTGDLPELEARDGAVLLRIAARPGAGRSAVQGVQAGALKVAIAAPPEKGKANKALVAYLAKALGVRRAQVALVAGETSRAKRVRVEGVGAAELRGRLEGLLGRPDAR